jgi:hypothetical protein
MRRLLLVALAAVTIAVPGGSAATASPARPAAGAVAAKVCHRGTPARINGQSKCLQPGEYCALSAERQYERYGYTCSTRYRPPRLRRRY